MDLQLSRLQRGGSRGMGGIRHHLQGPTAAAPRVGGSCRCHVRRQRRAPPTTAAQASRTEVVLQPQQQQQQPAAVPKQQQSGWSPWRVVNPFGGAARSTKETQGELVTVSEAQLWQMLETETVPLVVVFSAKWCGPCTIMVQRLENILRGKGTSGHAAAPFKAVKIDTDASPELATALKVHKLPTMFFTGPGAPEKPAAQITGLLPEAVLVDMVTHKSAFLGTDIRKAVVW